MSVPRFTSSLALALAVTAAACGDDSSVPTGSASGVGGGGGSDGQGGAAATQSASAVTTSDASTATSTGVGGDGSGGDTTGTGGGEVDDLDSLLARLRADRDGTLREEADEGGWPVLVEGGRVVVSTDDAFDTVAGDFDEWVGTPLTADEGFAWGLVPDVEGDRYKLVAGDTFEADPWARSYTYDEFGEITFVTPPAEAHLERWPIVEGAGLAQRTVRVWVPAEEATHVLYVHDGQNLFDPDAFFGGWRLQDAAPPAMLLVGIDNTGDRMDEYTHVEDDIGAGGLIGGAGDAYAELIRDVVRPLIDGRYGEPPVVGTMGSSLGGLISLHLALHDSGDYDFAASLSGTLGWGSIGAANETMIERYAAAGLQPFAIYLDSGGGGTTCADSDEDGTDDDDPTAEDNYCETIQMRDVLIAEGWEEEVDLVHWHEPDAEHNELAWAERVFRPLDQFAALR
jgi:predicted alpha/beta superfamily hydrolase